MSKGKFSLRGFLVEKFLINQAEKHGWLPTGAGVAGFAYLIGSHIPRSVYSRAFTASQWGLGRIAVARGWGLNVKPESIPRTGVTHTPSAFSQSGVYVGRSATSFTGITRVMGPLLIGGPVITRLSSQVLGWMSPDPMTTTH